MAKVEHRQDRPDTPQVHVEGKPGQRRTDADRRQRRHLPSQSADWPAKYIIEGGPRSEWGGCEVVDISILGADLELFEVSPPDIIGRPILVEVQTPAGASITLQMVGEIASFSVGARGGTRVGIEFGELSNTEKAILDALEHMRAVW